MVRHKFWTFAHKPIIIELLMFVTADEEYLRYCKRNNFIYNSQINALTDRTEICIFNIPLVESNIEKRYIVESER